VAKVDGIVIGGGVRRRAPEAAAPILRHGPSQWRLEFRLARSGDAAALEPAVRCETALLSPSSGIVSSHELMQVLLGDL